VASPAELVDRGRAAGGADDRQIRKSGFRGEPMVAARSVADLTADRMVARFGTGLSFDGTGIGCVALQTSP
jgi:hypothetical protein